MSDRWWSWDTEDDGNWLSEFSGEDVRSLVRERNRLLDIALAPSTEPTGDPDYMCPNCVTPWKCNGPHILERRGVSRQSEGLLDAERLAALLREHWLHEPTRRCACGAIVAADRHPEHIAEALAARLHERTEP